MNYETIEIDVATNETTIVETILSENEIAEGERIRLEREAELNQAVEAKNALLEKLGITEDEAKLLLS